MSELKLCVADQVLKITNAPIIASGGVNEVKVLFTFCDKWDGFIKTALFYRDTEHIYYSVLDENDTGVMPWEVYTDAGAVYISVIGEKGDTRRTSTVVRYKIGKGVNAEEMLPSEPSPDVYDRIIAMYEEARDVAVGANSLANEAKDVAIIANQNANDAKQIASGAQEAAVRAEQTAVSATERVGKAEATLKDVVLHTEQTLTEEQKTQARVNIGAASVADLPTVVCGVIDKVCPNFTESGALVTCEPVGGYPLNVVSKISKEVTSATLYRCSKNLIAIANTQTINGITLTMDADGTIHLDGTATAKAWFYLQTAFKLPIMDYMLSAHNATTDAVKDLGFQFEDNTFNTQDIAIAAAYGVKSYATKGVMRMLFSIAKDTVLNDATFQLQVEVGTSITDYEAPQNAKFTANFGETVSGGNYDWTSGVLTDSNGNTKQLTPTEILALPGVNVLYSDTGETTVSGKADPRAVIQDLYGKINALSATMTALTGV